VQGVGYRAWTARQARALALRGTVRNLPDGTVAVEAAGAPEALVRLRELLEQGPPAARVSAVVECEPDGSLPPDFQVVM
jgi:acylphosphatase